MCVLCKKKKKRKKKSHCIRRGLIFDNIRSLKDIILISEKNVGILYMTDACLN